MLLSPVNHPDAPIRTLTSYYWMQAAESYPATTEFAYRVFYYFNFFTLALCEKWGQNNIDFTFYFEVVVVGQNRNT